MTNKKKNPVQSQSLFSELVSILLYFIAIIVYLLLFAVCAGITTGIMAFAIFTFHKSMNLSGLFFGIAIGIASASAYVYIMFKSNQDYDEYYRLTGTTVPFITSRDIQGELAKLRERESILLGLHRQRQASMSAMSNKRALLTLGYAIRKSLNFIVGSIPLSLFILFLANFSIAAVLLSFDWIGIIGALIALPFAILFFVMTLSFSLKLGQGQFVSLSQAQAKEDVVSLSDTETVQQIKYLPTAETMQELISQDGEIPDDAFSQSEQ